MAEPAADPIGVLPRAALTFLRRKKRTPSEHWRTVWREEHAVAFTVAQLTHEDALEDTHKALTRALRKGETFETFRARIEPLLRARGWKPTGRGGNIPRRLRRIFDTNLRSARAAGRWNRIERTADLLPWLLYTLGPSRVHRPDHQEWAGVCLRHDDPWWTTHYPPNGWGCKCSVRQVAEPPAGAQTTAPRVRTVDWVDETRVDKKTRGHKVRKVPEGIDPGWDFNAGQRRTAGVNGALVRRLDEILSGAGTRLQGASAAARETLTRRIVGRHIAGPAFRWFVERPRPAGKLDWRQARPEFIEATPAGVLRRELAERIGADTPLLRLNERAAHKQQIHHPELSADDYVRVQKTLDDAQPRPADEPDRWLFDLPRFFRVLVEVADGQPQLVSAHRLSRKKGRAD